MRCCCMRNILGIFLLLSASLSYAAELRGKIVSQATGEPLGNVAVSLVETGASVRTVADGSFVLAGMPAGKYTLRVDAVGFWFHRVQVEVVEADTRDFSISLTPQGARRTDTVEVTADVFGGADPAAVSQLLLTTSELKQTDTVFAGDLFRSVQTMPGVTGESNNDFFSQFMVLGAPFSSVGVYVDDVLVRQPFHGISDQREGASIGVMNDDVIDTLTLNPVAFSQKYAEGTAAALDIRTREGSRERTTFGVGVGMAESHATLEGALPAKQGSWLVSARKSYLGYLTRHAVGEGNPMEPSFSDVTARFAYNLAPRQTLDFLAMGGFSRVDDSWDGYADPNVFFTGKSKFSLVRAGWKAGLTPDLLLSLHAAHTSQGEVSRNVAALPLATRSASEWVGGGKLAWTWKRKQTLETGWTVRKLNGRRLSRFYEVRDNGEYVYGEDDYWGVGIRHGGYLQQSVSFWHDRLVLMGSLRGDGSTDVGGFPFSGHISGSLGLTSSTRLIAGTGNYVQYPEITATAVPCDRLAELFSRSNHYLLGLEQRAGENTRIRVQGFKRDDADRIGARGLNRPYDPSLPEECGPVEPIEGFPPRHHWVSTGGGQVIIQRRSANRLSGWISYTYLQQRQYSRSASYRGGEYVFLRSRYRGPGDQRNSVNLFGSYRLRPTLSLSGKLLYGSGYPGNIDDQGAVPVYLDGKLIDHPLTNTFLRLDLRVDKAFRIRGQRVTLHGEVLNVTDHKNIRFITSAYTRENEEWQPVIVADRALRFTPTVGLDFQF